MERISEILAGFLLNATWQIALIALVAWACSRLLRNAAARYRHALWAASIVLALALPLWGQIDFSAARARQQNAALGTETSPALTFSNAATNTTPDRVAASTSQSGPPALGQLLSRRKQPLAAAPTFAFALALAYALFLLFRLGALWRSWMRTRELRRSARERAIPGMMDAVAVRCRSAFGLRGVPLTYSSKTTTPVTVGALDPLIILPESFFAPLPEETLTSVLGHEMAHIRRRDYALNLACEFLWLPVSFHPLANFIRRRVKGTRELACDEMVTERLLEPKAYARALMSVAGALVSPAQRAFTLGIFDADILEERIMKLTKKTGRPSKRAARVLALTAFTLLSLSCLTISTFSFELRTEKGFDVAGVHMAAVEDVMNETGDAVAVGGETFATGRSNEPSSRALGGEQISDAAAAQARAQEACEAEKRGTVETIPLLVEMLGDDRPTRLLRCWQGSRWSPALETFKQASPGEQAAIALASMGTPSVEPLTNALNNSNQSVRRNAAWAIGELTNMRETERAGAVPSLISLLNDGDEWVRMAAARALGEIRDERAVEKLVSVLNDGSWKVRELCAWSLGEMKEERAVQALCRLLLEDAQVEVRERAAWALGEIRDPQAAPFLKQALGDAETRVREKSRWALSEIEDSDG
jgi:HEAT repeat protein/beta-lactamase regulating signal transducer with metallopeptidase domain